MGGFWGMCIAFDVRRRGVLIPGAALQVQMMNAMGAQAAKVN